MSTTPASFNHLHWYLQTESYGQRHQSLVVRNGSHELFAIDREWENFCKISAAASMVVFRYEFFYTPYFKIIFGILRIISYLLSWIHELKRIRPGFSRAWRVEMTPLIWISLTTSKGNISKSKDICVLCWLWKSVWQIEHTKMLRILQKYGIDKEDLQLIKTLYFQQKANVRIGGGVTEKLSLIHISEPTRPY